MSKLPVVEKRYIVAFALTSTLFFAWGLASQFNDLLLHHFQKARADGDDVKRGQEYSIDPHLRRRHEQEGADGVHRQPRHHGLLVAEARQQAFGIERGNDDRNHAAIMTY